MINLGVLSCLMRLCDMIDQIKGVGSLTEEKGVT